MTNSKERHRLSLIIATLGPSTDDEKELVTMLIAGIARQWTDGVDIARVVHGDGETVVTNRVNIFREQCKKRKLDTAIYLDTNDVDDKNFQAFFDASIENTGQIWMTGTNLDLFKKLKFDKKIQYLEVNDSNVTQFVDL